jgi:hypothetical protein
MADACAVQQGRPKGLAMASVVVGACNVTPALENFFTKMASNEKCFNYKVIDLFENYNFHRKFVFI